MTGVKTVEELEGNLTNITAPIEIPVDILPELFRGSDPVRAGCFINGAGEHSLG